MARNSKKRNADTSLEDLDDLLRSPSNRSRRSEGDCGDEEISNDESRVEYHDKEEDREPVAEDSIRDASQYKQEEQGSDDDVLAADNQGDAENSHDGQEDGDPNDENMHPEEDDGDAAENDEDGIGAEHGVKNFLKINVEGRPAEAGVIKQVRVENFMCHRKLTVALGRNVNFIHGANGSGKSAILAAIQICLGANARRTHRARNVKDLVRKEAAGSGKATTAKVQVTLLNGGEDAFKPEEYGNQITIERVISLGSANNGYR